MKKLLTLIFIALLLILFAEAGFYFYLNKIQKPADTTHKSYQLFMRRSAHHI